MKKLGVHFEHCCFFKFCITHQCQTNLLRATFLTSEHRINEEITKGSQRLPGQPHFGRERRLRGSRTCHEEQEAGHVLGQALLPEEADRGHDAATEQDSHGHAQEAGGDSSQI